MSAEPNTEPASLLVGTAGHIDHGKSALVQALTGSDPDRLEEEKERGITIDLGFAHLELDAGHVGFVDVPGHERFVKNMLAGIGGIDAVLLVVAADESVMPQTREHFQICRLLGIPDGVVAVTKCDRVDEEIVDLVELEVRDLVAGSFLENATVVHTSATRGDGLDDLRSALAALRRRRRARDVEGPVRLPVDRVFTVHGFGTVVTGTLMTGRVRTGDALELLPSGERLGGVRGIQVHGQEVELASAGQRTALNVPGIDVDAVERGDLLVTPGALGTTRLVDARLRLLPGFDPVEPLQRVRFHHGAAEIMARLVLLDSDRIDPGDTGLVQVRLEAPYAVLPGDRFIVRRYSPMITIGGGMVLDPLPEKRRGRRPRPVKFLQRIEGTGLPGRLRLFVERAGVRGMPGDELRRRLGLTGKKLEQLAAQATAGGAVVAASEEPLHLVHLHAFDPLKERLLARLSRYHDDNPLRPAMPKEELRSTVAARVPGVVFEAALQSLRDAGHIRAVPDGLARDEHQVRLDADQRRLQEELIELFEEAGLTPPAPEAVARRLPGQPDPATVEPLLHHLLRQERLVRVKEDMLVDAGRLQALIQELRSRHAPGVRFSVAQFKEWTDTSRKHAIPLLEYLDRERITRRVGDDRELL